MHPYFYDELSRLVPYTVVDDDNAYVKIVEQTSSNDGFTVKYYKWSDEELTFSPIGVGDLPDDVRTELVVE